MFYARLTQRKFTTFSVFMAMLAVSVAATLLVAKSLPGEYLSFDGLKGVAKQPLEAVWYKMNFDGTGNNFFTASAFNSIRGTLFPNSSMYSTDTSSSTEAFDIPVLVYHGITSKADRFSMTKETFKEQMFSLKRAGYETITLNDFDEFLKGNKKLNEKSFLLTFDDGRTDSYTGADPILQALGYSAVMFVATHDSLNLPNVPNSYYLREAILKKMISSGRWEMGSHTVQDTGGVTGGLIPIDESGTMGYLLSNKMWLSSEDRLETDDEYKDRITRELKDSKTDLEKRLNIRVSAISYPFGDFGQQTLNNSNAEKVINELVSSTYAMAFHQVWPSVNLFTSNTPYTARTHLLRVESGTDWTGEYLVNFLENARTKSFPYNDSFTTNQGWKSPWGEVVIQNNEMHLTASPDTSGAFAFLDGTSNWDDYMFTISAPLENENHITLFARWKDRNNSISCTFNREGVRIDQREDGASKRIQTVRAPVVLPQADITFGIQVDGNLVRCYEGSRVVAYEYAIPKNLPRGGIGVQVWNEKTGTAALRVTSLHAVLTDHALSLKEVLPVYPSSPKGK